MARLVVSDKPKPRLEVVEPNTRRKVTRKEIEKALGAERVATIPVGGSPMSAFLVRQELFSRLRSTGGRPSLEGAEKRQKIPIRPATWEKLEQLAMQVESGGSHPTPAQLASVILDAGIDEFARTLGSKEAKAKMAKP